MKNPLVDDNVKVTGVRNKENRHIIGSHGIVVAHEILNGTHLCVVYMPNAPRETDNNLWYFDAENVEKINNKCNWGKEFSIDDAINYKTDCDNMFYFSEGSPKEHEMDYCCFCGKKIN